MGRRLHDGWSLARLTSHGWDCVFLDREKVSARRSVVSTDPDRNSANLALLAQNLESPEAWEVAEIPHPGMGQGPVIPIEEIRISRDDQV